MYIFKCSLKVTNYLIYVDLSIDIKLLLMSFTFNVLAGSFF